MPPLPDVGFVEGTNNLGEDEIVLTTTPFDGQNVKLTLSVNHDITWWKGICKGQWEMLATQDDRKGPMSGVFPMSDLENAGVYKGKVFGVHTYMYPLKVKGGFKEGNEYHFRWTRDA